MDTIFNIKIILMIKRKPLCIRLKKIGKRTSREFIIVLTEVGTRGLFKEILGKFNSRISGKFFTLKSARLGYWLNKGAILNSKVKILIGKYGSI